MSDDPARTPEEPADDDSADTPPALPSEDDDSPLGDTDQHSGSDA